MKLRELRIQNFKAIEDATIDQIGDIDIFSGRNNAGKSTILEVLLTLGTIPIYPELKGIGLDMKFFPGKNINDKLMKVVLIFELNETECSKVISHSKNKEIMQELRSSPFFKEIEYTFQNRTGSGAFGLSKIRVKGIDGLFGTIFETDDWKRVIIKNVPQAVAANNTDTLNSVRLSQDRLTENNGIPRNPAFSFPFTLLRIFFSTLYAFSPFRRSQPSMEASTIPILANDGNNLVQRIFTFKQNEDDNWNEIRNFVKVALPDLGELQSRTTGTYTNTVFKDNKWKIEIDVHDMGSGIEQLLMIACVLISKRKGSLILMENPEHHLHPGAQMTLLQFIKENIKDNQVLITTHSPLFLSQRDLSLHIVTKTNEGTKVKKVKELEDLSFALSELGSKNSDLLMADYVLFVEGPTDKLLFTTWAKTLGVDFESGNIFCITLGGSRNFDYYANSNVLQRISTKSPVPHLFVIDSDEKSENTVKKIKNKIKEIHILERREIENYLLSPEIILRALKVKAEGKPDALEKLQNMEPKDIEQRLLSKIEGLKHLVILKRIKEEIGGGTFLPSGQVENLIKATKNADIRVLTDKITKVVQDVLDEQCGKERIKQTVNEQVLAVNKIWNEGNEEEKKKVVPGEEVLTELFKEFGLNYNKKIDGQRIAQQMKTEEIPNEIKSIINRINSQVGLNEA